MVVFFLGHSLWNFGVDGQVITMNPDVNIFCFDTWQRGCNNIRVDIFINVDG
jgi:hypothetical protein